MSVCPNCHTEYESSIIVCETCKTDLVYSPEIIGDEDAGIEPVELATFPTVSEAEMVKEILEKNGIRTIEHGSIDPIGTASGAEPITLLVEERFLPRAQEIYEAYFAGEGSEQSPADQE